MRWHATVVSMITVFVASMTACDAMNHPPKATVCFVLDGDRSLYSSVDDIVMKVGSRDGFRVAGSNPSVRIIGKEGSASVIVVTSPFGSHASIISLFERDGVDLNDVVVEIRSNAEQLGLRSMECSSVNGLEPPILGEDPVF